MSGSAGKREAQLTEAMRRRVMREMGAKGGRNSRANLTDEEKEDLARRAVTARWARWRRDNGKPPKPGDEEYLKG